MADRAAPNGRGIHARELADLWNDRHPIGTLVRYNDHLTYTLSCACTLDSHRVAVILLEGYIGVRKLAEVRAVG